jgi:hypothetical protein
MASDQLVQRVDECRGAETLEQTAERAGQPHLGEEPCAPSAVTRYRGAVTQHQPPTAPSLGLGDGCEQTVGLRIGERKHRQFLAPVERGDEPRRPAAEPSAARVQQDRAWTVSRCRGRSVLVLCHGRGLCHDGRAIARLRPPRRESPASHAARRHNGPRLRARRLPESAPTHCSATAMRLERATAHEVTCKGHASVRVTWG